MTSVGPFQLKEVWVTTPDNIRVAQWKDVKTTTGMVQLEMQLTEEPPLVSTEGGSESSLSDSTATHQQSGHQPADVPVGS